METVAAQAGSLESVELVRFVLFGEDDLEVHEAALEACV